MNSEEPRVYPYIPNSVPEVKEEMLKEVGAESIAEFYEDVPDKLRLKERMRSVSYTHLTLPTTPYV